MAKFVKFTQKDCYGVNMTICINLENISVIRGSYVIMVGDNSSIWVDSPNLNKYIMPYIEENLAAQGASI